jgi:hypothetical protein
MPKKNFMTAAPAKAPPPAQFTEADVFILESLRFKDEDANRFEGKIIARILTLCGKNPVYYYFRTADELLALSDVFRASGYRFLHLSCHGTIDAIDTTLGRVSAERLADIFADKLKNRRLFVSACSFGSGQMAELVSEKNRGMYSIVCPMDEIRFNRAAAIWATFYVKMFDVGEPSKMSNGAAEEKGSVKFLKNDEMKKSLRKLCSLFNVHFRWAYHDTVRDRWYSEVIPRRLTGVPGGPGDAAPG